MVWKEIPGFSKYEASDDNQGIRNKKTKKNLSRVKNNNDYYICSLIDNNTKKSKSVLEHRLVAITFIDNLDNKAEVNHIDYVRDNNNVSNLEWNTREENIKHMNKRKRNINKVSKPVLQYKNNILIREYDSLTNASNISGIGHSSIHRVCIGNSESGIAGGYSWKYKFNYNIKDLEGEIWKDIPYHPKHKVSNKGRVKNIVKNTLIKGSINGGYVVIGFLKGQSNLLHRLVASIFLENPDNKPIVNHINGVKTDNYVENLEYVTYSENTQHAYDTGLLVKSNNRKVYQLSEEKVIIDTFDSLMEASKHVNRSVQSIVDACKGRTRTIGGYMWAYVDEYDENYKFYEKQKGKPVYKLDSNGDIIEKYKNVIKASEIIGCGVKTVRKYCRSGKLLKGYKYIFVEDYEKISKDITKDE